MANDTKGPRPGLGVDSSGGPTVDPTKNVLDLVDAAVKRIDDMAKLRAEIADTQIAALTEKIASFAAHQRDLDRAESERLNSIRQVDREEVTKTAAANQAAITTLATSTATLAETLRTQVAVTASAAESRQSASATEMTKRLSALELSASASMGKSTVADPQMERLALLVERLATAQTQSGGRSQGVLDSKQALSWLVAIALGLITLWSFTTRSTAATAPPPQVIMVPASPGTLIASPTTPAVPR